MSEHVRPALLNSASFGEPSEPVLQAMTEHLERERRIGVMAARSGYDDGAIRQSAAAVLGVDEQHVLLHTTTSAIWEQLVATLPLRSGATRALITPWEWWRHAHVLRRRGLEPVVMPLAGDVGDDGIARFDLTALTALLDDRVALISAPLVSSRTGIQVDCESLGALERPEGCWFLIDAAQALGHVPVAFDALRADLVASTARKWLRAPGGTAVAALSPAMCDAFSVERASALEYYDRSDAARVGLGVALATFSETAPTRFSRIDALSNRLRTRLAAMAGVTLCPGRSGIVSFVPNDADRAAPLYDALAAAGLLISLKGASDEPWNDGPAPVLRISPAADAREGDIDRALDIIEAMIAARSIA